MGARRKGPTAGSDDEIARLLAVLKRLAPDVGKAAAAVLRGDAEVVQKLRLGEKELRRRRQRRR